MGNGTMKYISNDLEAIIDKIQQNHKEVESSVAASQEVAEIFKILSSIKDLKEIIPEEWKEKPKKPTARF